MQNKAGHPERIRELGLAFCYADQSFSISGELYIIHPQLEGKPLQFKGGFQL
jgi:hypothetical protein